MDNKIVGSLGLLSYEGYVKDKKQNIGFFVDNCILPEYNARYGEILCKLFEVVEKQAKIDKIDYIIGWDYTKHAKAHNELYKKMGYSRIDGINWFGGGTKHIDCFSDHNFKLPLIWKLVFKLMNYQIYRREVKLKPLKNEKIRGMSESDIPDVVQLLNAQNSKLEFSPRYTIESLKESIKKYCAKGLVLEVDKKIIGILILFVAPWSGWMYGKPEYTRSYSYFLIKHPLEFAVLQEYIQCAPHLLIESMKQEKERYFMLVDVFDRRVSWKKDSFVKIGADEFSYDYGTIFLKNLSGEKINLDKPIYIPTNLVISPYTSKDY